MASGGPPRLGPLDLDAAHAGDQGLGMGAADHARSEQHGAVRRRVDDHARVEYARELAVGGEQAAAAIGEVAADAEGFCDDGDQVVVGDAVLVAGAGALAVAGLCFSHGSAPWWGGMDRRGGPGWERG